MTTVNDMPTPAEALQTARELEAAALENMEHRCETTYYSRGYEEDFTCNAPANYVAQAHSSEGVVFNHKEVTAYLCDRCLLTILDLVCQIHGVPIISSYEKL